MNEQIRALAEQAEQYARDDLIERRAVGAPLYAEGEYDSMIKQKFAELIVSECAEIGQQSVTRGIGMAISQHALPDYVKGKIQTHFGVAE